jgi:hypothetical protein
MVLLLALWGCRHAPTATQGAEVSPKPVATSATAPDPPVDAVPPPSNEAQEAAPRALNAPLPSPPAVHTPPSTAAPGGPTPPARAPEARPGLATAWGEELESHTCKDPTFERSPSPFASASIFYNDEKGVAALLARNGEAAVHRTRELSAAGGLMSVAFEDAGGQSLEIVSTGGRSYVVGHGGERYMIRLTNHTNFRIVSVSTVDGLNVITGEPGSPSGLGYIVEPMASMRIEGFRKSFDAVAAFRFSSVAESYAAQRGNARNVGVVGFAFVSRRGEVPVLPSEEADLAMRETAIAFPGVRPLDCNPPYAYDAQGHKHFKRECL